MTTLSSPKLTKLTRIAAVALTLGAVSAAGTVPADARAGGGFSFGSRGTRTFSAPPTTMTAPRPASPFQRSETPSMGNPSWAGQAAQPRRFGFGSGLAAGLLGAGLFGLMSGHGFFGGLGGISSLFGLLLQIGLIVLLVRFAMSWFAGRNARPSYAAGPQPMGRTAYGSGFGGGGAQQAPLTLEQGDFAIFERMLSDIQLAYGREDMTAIERLATPEMARNLGSELDSNRRQGVRNDLSDVRLLQGDLSEAWREPGADYATVAMRFAARDVTLERATGRVVSGDPNRPVEATELWTFRRTAGDGWRLAAIQQTG